MSDDKCKGTNNQGQSCRAAAGESGYCYFHANPGAAAQVGRMGGRQNRHVIEGHATPLPPLNSISGIQGAVDQTIEDLRMRRLPPGRLPFLPACLVFSYAPSGRTTWRRDSRNWRKQSMRITRPSRRTRLVKAKVSPTASVIASIPRRPNKLRHKMRLHAA